MSLEDMLSSYFGPLTLVTVQVLPLVATFLVMAFRLRGLLPSCLGSLR